MEFPGVKCYGPPPEILLTSGKMLHPSDLSRILIRYCEPDMRRALFEVGITVVPLVLLWVLMWLSLDVGYWLTLLLAVPAGGFLVRLFIIQHDCGHGAFFRQRAANAWVGRVLGVLTLTPFDYWKRNHAIHHATSSNLDKRGIGDIDLLTVEEYRGKSWWGRMVYRCYRSAPVMFVIGPAWLFLLQHRLPFHQMARWLAALDQHHGDQCRHRPVGYGNDLACGCRSVRDGASADHAAGGVHGRMAVLCAAPVRGCCLGAHRKLVAS